MKDLIRKIRGWANARNIIKGSTALNQYAKLMSEAGELASAIPQLAYADVEDGVGDCFVVLVIICAILDIRIEACCDSVVIQYSANNALRGHERIAAQSASFLELSTALGKLGDSILKNDIERITQMTIGAIGSLNRIAQAQGYTFEDCVMAAYVDIKDRKGVMYNGAFVKSSDARYPAITAELGLEA